MTKAQIIEDMASRMGVSKAMAAQACDAFMESVEQALKLTGEAKLPGFGVFEMVERKERQGRNPRTGETVTIPARRAVKFRPGAKLKALA